MAAWTSPFKDDTDTSGAASSAVVAPATAPPGDSLTEQNVSLWDGRTVKMRLPSSIKSVTAPEAQAAIRQNVLAGEGIGYTTLRQNDPNGPTDSTPWYKNAYKNFTDGAAMVRDAANSALTYVDTMGGRLPGSPADSFVNPRALIPQTGTEAAVDTALGLTGTKQFEAPVQAMVKRLTPAVESALSRLVAKATPPAARIAATAASGEVGNQLEGGPTGQGLIQGATVGAIGEVPPIVVSRVLNNDEARKLTGRLFKGGSTAAVERQVTKDAATIGNDVIATHPDLQSVIDGKPLFGNPRTPAELYDLTIRGDGQRLLQSEQNQLLDRVGQIVPENALLDRPLAPGEKAPPAAGGGPDSDAIKNAKDAVRRGLQLKPGETPAGGWDPYLQAAKRAGANTYLEGPSVEFDGNNQPGADRFPIVKARLQQLYRDGIAGSDKAMAAYWDGLGKLKDTIQQRGYDLQGELGQLLTTAKDRWGKGQALLSTLAPAFPPTGPKRIPFNTYNLQTKLDADQTVLRSTLGDDLFNKLEAAAYRQARGAPPLQSGRFEMPSPENSGQLPKDYYPSRGSGIASGLGHISGISGMLHGAMHLNPYTFGAGAAMYAAPRLLAPGAQFAGNRAAFPLAPAMQRGLRFAGQAAATRLPPLLSASSNNNGQFTDPLGLLGIGPSVPGDTR